MLYSLKSKIFLIIILTMTATAAAVIYFSDRDIGRAIMKSEEASVQNVIQFIDLNIKQTYSQLLTNRINSTQRNKDNLQDLSNLAISALERFSSAAKSGLLRDDEAKNNALAWLRSAHFSQGTYWFLFDQNARIIAHPNSAWEKRSVQTMTDIKGRSLASMLCNENTSSMIDFAVFSWKNSSMSDPGKKLGYFKYFPQWDWILATVVDIQELENEARVKKAEALASLKASFANIQIAQSGAVFLFDGQGQMLIPPTNSSLPESFLSDPNPKTSQTFFKDLSTQGKLENSSLTCMPTLESGLQVPYKIYVSYFKPFDWYFAAAIPLDEIALPARKIIQRQTMVISIIFLASLILSYIFVSRISSPLKQLSKFAKQIPAHDFSTPLAMHDMLESLTTSRKDEVGQLANSFTFMVEELEGNIRQLLEVTAARERIEGELNIARQIQLGILPKIFPAFPNRHEFDLFATLKPAKEVGGDLYDFFFVDEHRLCFTLGDVSDKGVPAALFMVITRTLVKTSAQHNLSPAVIMERVNNILSVDNPNSMFVTLIIGILDTRSGEIRYANGGHNPPVLMTQSSLAFKKAISGPVVGAIPELPYKELSLSLEPNDALFLYTDGVNEAMDADLNEFSNAALLRCLELHSDTAVDATIAAMFNKIDEHVKDAPQSDDIAMMMIRYKGATSESPPDQEAVLPDEA